ncbi:16294_t:CDS:1, partial [Racocetra fulgida]
MIKIFQIKIIYTSDISQETHSSLFEFNSNVERVTGSQQSSNDVLVQNTSEIDDQSASNFLKRKRCGGSKPDLVWEYVN